MIQPDFEIIITLYIFSLSYMNLQIFRFYRLQTRLWRRYCDVLLKHKVDIGMFVHSPKPLFLKIKWQRV